ncbi:MAG: ABC transporter permease [Candidatus Aminicenantes bacterium]|nr:ABC transporter permease [Candidatus Aminicenantes bacterium]
MKTKHVNPSPPSAAEWMLKKILPDGVWNTPLGDFEEYYRALAAQKGILTANLWYWKQILRLFPGKIWNIFIWSWIMIKNYLKIILRTFKRNKGYTFINITGLSIGLAGCILILLFVHSELSYDRFHEKADRIYRVALKARMGTDSFEVANTPSVLADTLVKDLPEVIDATRLFRVRQTYIKYEENIYKEEHFLFADPDVFEVFDIPLLAGDAKTALKQPHSVVISAAAAEKYFATTQAVGKVLIGENNQSYQVTAVAEDLPGNSHFSFDFLASSLDHEPSRDPDWITNIAHTYVVLQQHIPPKQLDEKLETISRKYIGVAIQKDMGISYDDYLKTGNYFGFFSQPLLDIHLHSDLGNELGANGNYTTVVVFSIIAVLILVVACINFINLATARAAKRANEVGIRKVVGSFRRQLITQFLTESVFLSGISMALALGLVLLLYQMLNNLLDINVSLAVFQTIPAAAGLLAAVVVIGILAGMYPSFLLSSFRPVAVLKGKVRSGIKGRRFRNVLVVFQFFASVFLFIGTIVIFNQLRYMKNKNLGFNKEHIVIVDNVDKLGSHQAAFKNELEKNADIRNASYSVGLPQMRLNAQPYRKEGDEARNTFILVRLHVDIDFFDTYGLEMADGRSFSGEIGSDSEALVINQSAAAALEFSEPLGKRLLDMNNEESPPKAIIGIVKNFHIMPLNESIRPTVLTLMKELKGDYLSVRIRPGTAGKVLGFLKEKWAEAVPSQPLEFTFFDERFNHHYREETRMGKLSTAFAVLAVFIACLGLFGLALFMSEERTKEIGVRKTLGASVPGVVFLLARDFAKWVLFANILAWPAAYFAMHKWLQNFAYRMGLSIWIFLVSGGISLAIALFTVSYQAVKSALANPVESLRYE